jgi:predicted  nucleic acid-binding Zn-ribbon protein
MIKNLIAPIQAWLLSQGRCVGCGIPLKAGVQKQVRGQTTVTCHCGRIFIYDPKTKKYRRALFDEI